MKNVQIIEKKELTRPKFIKTELVQFKREGEEPSFWERIKTHDSVHILVYNKDKDSILLVKQVRIPVLVRDLEEVQESHTSKPTGIVYEACAGIVDKNTSLVQIAKEEVLEELGFDVKLSNIDFIREVRSSVGTSGAKASLFYCEVDESIRVSVGGGLESEDIEVFELNVRDIMNFTFGEETTDSTTLYLLNWFLQFAYTLEKH